MAKKIRRFLAITMALALCFMLTSPSASAWGWGPPGGGNNNDDSYEWYEVYVQGNLVASGQGRKGDVYFLGTHYEAGVNINGNSLTWHINPIGGSSGNFSGTVNLFDYIEIPEGYEVQDYDIEELSIDGVNDPYYDMYDNAVIRITIKSLYNEETDDTIIIPDPDPTEPEPTEPEPTEPEPTEPEPTEPEPTEPEPTEPEPTEPEPTEPVDYDPVLTITKTADKEVYEVGETVTWTITVTNTGEDTAYDIVVEDPLTGDTWEIEYLEAGESRSFTATSTAELAGSLENIVTVEWTDNDEIDDAEETDEDKSATDSETVTVEEPEVIEPDPTDPTEPDPTDPTEPDPTEPDPTEPDPTEPEPIQPEPTEPDDNDQPDITSDSYLIIPDEDVPLADVPVTGDMAILWAAISLFSGGGLILLNKKRKED